MARRPSTPSRGPAATGTDALDQEAWRKLEAAQSLHRNADVAGAIKLLNELVQSGRRHPYVLSLLGVFQLEVGAMDAAVTNCREAAKRAPNDAGVLMNCANPLLVRGFVSEAKDLLQRAFKLAPHEPDIAFKLARTYLDCGDFTEALRFARRYTASVPGDPAGHRQMLTALVRAGKFAEAERYWKGLGDRFAGDARLQFDWVDILVSAGAIDRAGAHAAALAAAAADASVRAAALRKLAAVHAVAGDLERALNVYADLLAVDPDDLDTHHARARLRLANGELDSGGREFAAISRNKESLSVLPHRRWNGEPLQGRAIALRSEQGIGEQIMFSTMVPDLLERGARITLESDYRLVALFQRSFPDCTCVGWSEPPSPALSAGGIDYQAALGDLLCAFRTAFDAFPKRRQILVPDPALVRETRVQPRGAKLVVGISWRSSSLSGGGDKSIALAAWRDILRVRDVTFVSLQYGANADEIQRVQDALGVRIQVPQKLDPTNDIDKLVALIASLDLVISVSNVTAHFAGAVGTPAWILVSKAPLWHWFRGREDSPWYPSLRLFRQAADAAGWGSVLQTVAENLKQLAASSVAKAR